MAHLEIQAPGLAAPETHPLTENRPLLLGRRPDPAAVTPAPASTATVASGSVSTNHLIAWRQGGATFLRDLRSRNGTWLRLPADAVVRVESDEGLRLQLAGGAGTSGSDAIDEPAEAAWTAREDYGGSIVQAVSRWSQKQSAGLAVSLLDHRPVAPEGYPGYLPLADGKVLEVETQRTLDDSSRLLGVLWRYVTKQNELFHSEEASRAEGMILASDAIRRAHRQVYEAATRGTRAMLLLGPSGSGKEGLARCFHRYTGRSGPFVARNCAMFSRELLRSELFGAEAGAFTGASRRVVGAAERAHNGTLFLDEIGDLGGEIQPMLLRFLDSGEYEPLGRYGQPQTADVRVVGATNRDLRAATRAGAFRADLWYRLSVQIVEVPPLKERPEDIELFLKQRQMPNGLSVWNALSESARGICATHSWDGNFRELYNFVEQLPLATRPAEIDADRCRGVLRRVSIAEIAPAPPAAPPAPLADEQWARAAVEAVQAYREDVGRSPETWDDLKVYVERFMKPLVFAHLAGINGVGEVPRGAIATLTRRLQTDRNTVNKQLERYKERFTGAKGA